MGTWGTRIAVASTPVHRSGARRWGPRAPRATWRNTCRRVGLALTICNISVNASQRTGTLIRRCIRARGLSSWSAPSKLSRVGIPGRFGMRGPTLIMEMISDRPDLSFLDGMVRKKSQHQIADTRPLKKSSSCSTIYLDDSTVSQPNLKNTVKCVALAVYYHIKNRTSQRQIDIFDEKLHPLTVVYQRNITCVNCFHKSVIYLCVFSYLFYMLISPTA